MRYLFVFAIQLLIIQQISSQTTVKGKITDQTTNQPVSYANIWVQNTNIGITASLEGEFRIDANEQTLRNSSIIISAIGYKDTLLLLRSMPEIIQLTPHTFEIDEVQVLPGKRNELVINDLSGKKVNTSLVNDTSALIAGRYFAFEKKHEDFPLIKQVIVYTHNANRGKFNLRLYSFDTTNVRPIKSLVNKNIIVKTKRSVLFKAKPVVVDLSAYKLAMPKNGLLVGVEWLIIPENKYKVTYTMKGSKKKKVKYHYAPDLVATTETEKFSYEYTHGRWRNGRRTPKVEGYMFSGLYWNPAITLVLSD